MTRWLRQKLRAWLIDDEPEPVRECTMSAPREPVILQLGHGVTIFEPSRELLEDAIRMRDDMTRAGLRLHVEEWLRWH